MYEPYEADYVNIASRSDCCAEMEKPSDWPVVFVVHFLFGFSWEAAWADLL